jgi:hypothetical protein
MMRVSATFTFGCLILLVLPQAKATDLAPSKAPALDYVRRCAVQGEGYFAVPGTEACLRIGGRVRAEIRAKSIFSRELDATGFRARGRINADARVPTEYGMLRSYVNFEITRSSGTYLGIPLAAPSVSADLHDAFIQFGGLTAGITQSYFDFFGNGPLYTDIVGSDVESADVLAYTLSWGSGLSSTISLEDRIGRQRVAGPIGLPLGAAPIVDPVVGFAYAGERLPDLVGNLKLEQNWGAAQISGALRQLRSLNLVTAGPVTSYPDTEYGIRICGSRRTEVQSHVDRARR